MALLSAYATAAEYRDRNDKVSTTDDTLILELLTTVSRVAERRMGLCAGAFNSATGTRYFNGSGLRRLWLRDAQGLNFLQSIDANGMSIDASQNGLYTDYAWDLSDAWLHGVNPNAALGSEPYTGLEIWPLGLAPLAIFPQFPGCVRIIGTWGWAAVPGAIKERVISITREILEVHVAGPTMTIAEVDSSIQLNPSARSMMSMLEQAYSRRMPV